MARFSLAVFCLLSFLDCTAVLAATTFGQAGDGVPTLHYDHETQIVSLDPDGLSLGLFLVRSKSRLLTTEEITLPESYWVTIAPQVTGYAANEFFIETDEGLSTVGYIDQPIVLGRLASPEVSFAELLTDLEFIYSLGPGTPNLVGDLTSTLPYEHYESEIEAIRLERIAQTKAEHGAAIAVQPPVPTQSSRSIPHFSGELAEPIGPRIAPHVAGTPEGNKTPVRETIPENKRLPLVPRSGTEPLMPSEQFLRQPHEIDPILLGNVWKGHAYACECGIGLVTEIGAHAIDISSMYYATRVGTTENPTITASQQTAIPEPASSLLILASLTVVSGLRKSAR